MRTRVKVCGFTRVDDAVAAARMGIDALGLVFYPASPRYIEPDLAEKLVAALPAFVSVVALFVDEQETNIRRILQQVPVDCLQFHGNEPPEACRIYHKPYIKALRVQESTEVMAQAKMYPDACGLLLDAFQADAKGGTGHPFDWRLIPDNCPLPIILAGGLNANNARLAVASVKPYALDVSSGVEAEKGIKDITKITAFLEAVSEGDRNKI